MLFSDKREFTCEFAYTKTGKRASISGFADGSGRCKWSAGPFVRLDPFEPFRKTCSFYLTFSPRSSTPSKRAHTQNPQSSIAITTPVLPSPARHKQRALQPGRIGRALPWRPFVHTYNSTTPPTLLLLLPR